MFVDSSNHQTVPLCVLVVVRPSVCHSMRSSRTVMLYRSCPKWIIQKQIVASLNGNNSNHVSTTKKPLIDWLVVVFDDSVITVLLAFDTKNSHCRSSVVWSIRRFYQKSYFHWGDTGCTETATITTTAATATTTPPLHTTNNNSNSNNKTATTTTATAIATATLPPTTTTPPPTTTTAATTTPTAAPPHWLMQPGV